MVPTIARNLVREEAGRPISPEFFKGRFKHRRLALYTILLHTPGFKTLLDKVESIVGRHHG